VPGAWASPTPPPDLPARAGHGLWLALDALAAVLVAPDCAACGRPLDEPSQGPVCRDCWAAVHRFTGGLRDRRAAAAGPYEGRLRDIIHAFKYDGRRTLAQPLATLIREAGRDILDGADIVVPVPLHWWRRRRRGFNQAALLAGHLGLPVCHALRRGRRTRPQAGLHADERRTNVAGAFRPAWRYRWPRARAVAGLAPQPLAGLVAVLVDDVMTTGATGEACARVLREAGVREVRVLTVARVDARPG
jgi:ComF family protein